MKYIILSTIILLALLSGTAYAITDISISDLDISQKNIYKGDMAQITVDFDVETTEDESKVTLSFYIDGRLETKITRYYSEKSESYTYSYDTKDLEIGTHTAEVITRIYKGTSVLKAEDSRTEKFEILEKKPTPDLTMNIYPKKAKINDNLHIFGYVDPTDELIEILVNGMPKTTIIANINGYYSTFIKIDKPGDHVITIIVGNTKIHKIINIAQIPKETEILPKEPKKDVIITIIEPKNEEIPSGNKELETKIENIELKIKDINTKIEKITETTNNNQDEDTDFNYIKVETSNKELDINQYESNLLRLTITNNENVSHLFSVSSDFSDKIIFLPEAEVIKSGQSKILPVYFSIDDKLGRYYGIIYVRNEERIVKEIPLTLFVSENDYLKKTIAQPFLGPSDINLIIMLLTIFTISLILSIAHKITKKTIKPLELSDIQRPNASMLKRIHNNTQPKPTMNKNTDTTYLVPWGNIIL
ncbi:MAG: hypothetical protein K0B07_00285 [DPANN group archaeon]|nr:hypothetical protein [DPANN group archaeon]